MVSLLALLAVVRNAMLHLFQFVMVFGFFNFTALLLRALGACLHDGSTCLWVGFGA